MTAKPITGEQGMALAGTEHQGPLTRMLGPCPPETFHTRTVDEGLFQCRLIEPAIPPGNLGVVGSVVQSVVCKGNQRAFADSIGDPDIAGDDVIEYRRHISTIGALWRRGESKQESGVETVEHAPPRRRLGMMDLVDDRIVERFRSEAFQHLGASKFLDRRQDEASRQVAGLADAPAHALGREAEGATDRRRGLGKQLGAVGDDDHPER